MCIQSGGWWSRRWIFRCGCRVRRWTRRCWRCVVWLSCWRRSSIRFTDAQCCLPNRWTLSVVTLWWRSKLLRSVAWFAAGLTRLNLFLPCVVQSFGRYYSSNPQSRVPAPTLDSRPLALGQPWKVFEFQKTEKVLELFWKMSRNPWKSRNMFIVKVLTRLGDCANFLP